MKIDSLKVKLLMAEHGLTQAVLAKRCGFSRQSLSTILCRGTASTVSTGKLSRGLGVDAREIIKEE